MLKTRVERWSGDAGAQRGLAQMYYHGRGVRQDMTEAVRFYQLATDQGDAQAQCNLGLMMRLGEGGLKKDDEAAAQLFRRAADQGYAPAQSNLGSWYHHGVGVPQDHAMAARLYRKAADQGVAAAQFNIGACYIKGEGVPQDLIAAAYWLRRAHKQNHEEARKLLQKVEADLRCSHCGGTPPAEGPQLRVCLCRSAAVCGQTDDRRQ